MSSQDSSAPGRIALLRRIDSWQQRRRGLSFVVAVFVRYREDRGRERGALLSYYGFISLFPLLLVLVTVLGIVLDDNPTFRDRVLDTVYARIPVVGAQLQQDTLSLSSSGLPLLVGLLVSLWSGLAVVRVAQDALNLQWAVPRVRRPGFVMRQLRGLGALAVVGAGILVTTAATSLAAFLPDLPWGGRVLGAALAVVMNVVLLTASFRVLVQSHLGWRAFARGGLAGGVALWVLQLVGATYVARVILGASDVYGAFATVFGLIVWIARRAHHTARQRGQRGQGPAAMAAQPARDARDRR